MMKVRRGGYRQQTGTGKHGERIASVNRGLAIEDMATGIRIHHRSFEKGTNQKLEL